MEDRTRERALNYYEILGVPGNASETAIRSAYRRLVRRYHPDISGSSSAERFREVQEAYETLGQSSRRHAYDLSLRERPAPVHVTVIRSRNSSPYAEPLVPPRNDFRPSALVDFDQIFDQLLHWFEADWL